jgi:hypothetical protein
MRLYGALHPSDVSAEISLCSLEENACFHDLCYADKLPVFQSVRTTNFVSLCNSFFMKMFSKHTL